MKRFLTSVVTIAAVVGIGFLATSAYFSDTETSRDNRFQAGAVDLKVDSECHYYHYNPSHPNAITNQALGILGYYDVGCGDFGTWDSTDLTQEKFFNFTDVKPGDLGETTLSLTLVDNDAWACMYVENVIDAENDRIDPEIQAGDLTDYPQGGELAKNLKFTAWLDQGINEGWQGKYIDEETGDKGEGDNFWQGRSTEPLLFVNQAITSEGVALALADAAAIGGPLKGGVTHYFGLAWCAGDMVVGPGNTLFCDGEPMGNEAQTDSLSADVRFYVEQARNNPNFVCPPIEQKEFVVTQDSGQNDINRNAGNRPYIDWVIEGNVVHFDFINPTANQHYSFFYRVDGEVGVPGTWSNTPITQGELAGELIGDYYNSTYTPPSTTISKSLMGSNEIQVGLRLGGEQNYYLDWIIFTLQ